MPRFPSGKVTVGGCSRAEVSIKKDAFTTRGSLVERQLRTLRDGGRAALLTERWRRGEEKGTAENIPGSRVNIRVFHGLFPVRRRFPPLSFSLHPLFPICVAFSRPARNSPLNCIDGIDARRAPECHFRFLPGDRAVALIALITQ